MKDSTKTRMTTFIKTKFKISEEISNSKKKKGKIFEFGPEITKLCLY